MSKKMVHFFGFRGDEYNRAKRIWGEPDFIHPVPDRRAYVEIDKDNDILIFANKERPEVLSRYRREYTARKFKSFLPKLPPLRWGIFFAFVWLRMAFVLYYNNGKRY